MIINEIKAKVFACYLGQRCANYSKTVTGKLVSIRDFDIDKPEVEVVTGNKFAFKEHLHLCQLILRPISALTDEDADMFFAEFLQLNKKELCHKPWLIDYLVRSTDLKSPLQLCFLQYQYLQSRGYDLPHFLLGGKTLKEAGLAIYENESNQD